MRRPHPATVLATLALLVVVVPPAHAALGKNTVGSKQLKTGAVKAVDLKNGAVTGTKIANGAVTTATIADGSVTTADLAPAARSVKAVVGSWSFSSGSTSGLTTTTPMGSLSTDGGGPLVVPAASDLVVTGRVFLRRSGGGAGSPICQLRLNGNPIGPPVYANLTTGLGASVALTAHAVVAAGSQDVSLTCSGGAGDDGGIVDVTAVAYPR